MGLNGVILFRQYMVKLLKSGTRIPRVELVEVGPSFDCTLRRSKFASSDLMREALRVPPQLQGKKKKNKETNLFGDKLGTIHMERQDLDSLDSPDLRQTKKEKRSLNLNLKLLMPMPNNQHQRNSALRMNSSLLVEIIFEINPFELHLFHSFFLQQ